MQARYSGPAHASRNADAAAGSAKDARQAIVDNRIPGEQELVELRRENRQLRMEVGVLEQAALIYARRRPP